MRFGGYFPYLKDSEIRSLQINCGGGGGSDNDDGDSGGSGLVGGRNSNVAERPQTSGEQLGANIISKGAGFVGSAIGGPLLGKAFSKVASNITSGPVSIDLRTGQPINQGDGGDSFQRSLSADTAGDRQRQFQTLGGGNVPQGQNTSFGTGAIGGAVSEELIGLRESIAEQRRQFDIGQANLTPFREAGVGALQEQQARLGLLGQEAQQTSFDQFAESPGQKWLRERGEKAVLRGASATGGLGGGNVQKALVQHGIGVAAQQEGEQFNRLAGISGTGQSTAVTQAQLGQQFAGDVGQLHQGAAQTRASGLLAQQALEQQQASADSAASAARRNQTIGLIGAIAPAAFDFIGGLF